MVPGHASVLGDVRPDGPSGGGNGVKGHGGWDSDAHTHFLTDTHSDAHTQ